MKKTVKLLLYLLGLLQLQAQPSNDTANVGNSSIPGSYNTFLGASSGYDNTIGRISGVTAPNNADRTIRNGALVASADKAVFSYSLDGVNVSGGVVDELLMNNTAWVTESGTSKKLQFFLNDTYNEKTELFAHSLRFTIPDKTGTVTMNADDDTWHVALFLAAGASERYILYANTSFTVTVTNLSSTRVSGTFSGKVKLTEAQRSGKNDFSITSGHFDIPLRTTKK